MVFTLYYRMKMAQNKRILEAFCFLNDQQSDGEQGWKHIA